MDRPFKGKLLLVGEGDFSLSVALVSKLFPKHTEGCKNVIATSLETEISIHRHRDAAQNIAWLKDKGVTIHLSTDATSLHQNDNFKDQKLERIVFNFPHAGGKSNHKKNRKLLNDFFSSASKILNEDGQIMMTLCKGQGGTLADKPMRKWHDSWQVVSMAANAGLILKEVVPFHAEHFHEYSCTGFRSQDKGFNTEGAITHVFQCATVIELSDLNTESSSYIPGKHYLEQKLKRKLYEEPGSPVQTMEQLLKDNLCKIYDGRVVQVKDNLRGEDIADETPSIFDKLYHTNISDSQSSQNERNFSYSSVLQNQLFSLSNMYKNGNLFLHSTNMVMKCPVQQNFLPVSHILIGILDELHRPYPSASSDVPSNLTSSSISDPNVKPQFLGNNTPCQTSPAFALLSEYILKTLNVTCQDTLMFRTNTNGHLSHEICEGDVKVHTLCDLQVLSHNGHWISFGQIASTSDHITEHSSGKFIFIFNLDILATIVYKLPNIRLLWSQDKAVLQNFQNCTVNSSHFIPTSLYPMMFTHDMSFWEPPDYKFDEVTFYDIIRDVAGDTITSVTLIDKFENKEMGKTSRCYRFVFQSFDKALMYDASWKIQSIIRLTVARLMNIILR